MSSAGVVPQCQATLKQYTKDYVFELTGLAVELFFPGAAISIKKVSKGSCKPLADLWLNVLKASIREDPTETNGGKNWTVKAEDMTFTVFMGNGTFMIQGPDLHKWFKNRFKNILDNYRQGLRKTGTLQPPQEDEGSPQDPITGLEDNEVKVDPTVDGLAEDIGNLTLDKPLWEGGALEAELQTLHQGAVKGGKSYIYKLWKSLLTKWFSTIGTKVYLASPFLDAERLADVVDIFLKYETKGDLEAFYVRNKCNKERDIQNVQRDALRKFESRSRVFIKKNIFPKMFSPIKWFHCKFAAGVSADGEAEVLVTSANFHGNHFACDNMETVVFIRMREKNFFEKYVNSIVPPVGATT